MSNIILQQTFALETCCNCGVAFAVPADFQVKRRSDRRSFYCPNGHSQSYTHSVDQKARKDAEERAELLSRELSREQGLRRIAEQEATRQLRAKRRLEKRIASGVCPCCNRTFQDLARHMDTKHKGFALPPASEQKLIAGTVQ